MEFLYFLESIRTPALDAFFSTITHLGSEVVFMVLAVTMYWCVSKTQGLYLLSVGCLGATVNQALKITFRVPRPWVKDPTFAIVESARAEATGYSFPSGHTQNAVGTFGCAAMSAKRRWVSALCIALALLTALSRMYLGVHTLSDVAVSLVIASAMVILMHPLFKDLDAKPQKGIWILLSLILVNVAFLIYATCWPFPADADAEQLAHGVENAAKLTGALLGMALGYWFDLKRGSFRTEASFLGQVLKTLLGLAGLMLFKEGLKPLLGDAVWAGILRYALMTFFAAGIWPMAFPRLAKIGRKKD